MAFGKKKDAADGLDVLTDIKEPFSFANFFEEHVVERVKKIKRFLEEKGILFFLLSPFQQRNRLIVQLVIIVIGLLAGVIPRSMNLVEQAKERNAASEMAALIDKDTQITYGSINVRPIASSQYEKQHLLAFLVTPGSGGTVPSTADHFDVRLSAARGVSDGEHVQYAYEVVPVSEDARLLLVYADNRKQNDETGIYNLTVELPDDNLSLEQKTPMEVVLSNTQKTTELFGKDGVNLSSLTKAVLNDPNTPVMKAWEAFDTALSDYEMETERIASLPLDLSAVPTAEELTAYTKEETWYPLLTDTSTTKDIVSMEEVLSDGSAESLPSYEAEIVWKGKSYTAEYFEMLGKELPAEDTPDVTAADESEEAPASEESSPSKPLLSEEEEVIARELALLQDAADDVLNALTQANNACQTKYQTLKSYKLMLNQSVDVHAFPQTRTVQTATE